MEATEANVSIGSGNQLPEISASVHPTTDQSPEFYRGLLAAYPQCKRPDNPSVEKIQDSVKHPSSGCHSSVQTPDPPVAAGVSNCYVFKSRLQEYAQKVGISTPTYETLKEGPSHMPSFQSTVIFSGVRYDSLPGFSNRKAAEQSAAEVALMNLSAGATKEAVFVPVHETGLCKNVLQEYAQKMNYAIPTYTCKKDGSNSRTALYSCTVDIGGIQYIGATARSKKDAEVKAARTALLAIRSTGNVGGDLGSKNNLTVVPCKRKVPESTPSKKDSSKPKKSMKSRPRKKSRKNIRCGLPGNQTQAGKMAACVDNNMGTPVTDQTVHIANNGESVHCLENTAQINGSTIRHIGEPSGEEGNGSPCVPKNSDTCRLTNFQQEAAVNTGMGDSTASLTDANTVLLIETQASEQFCVVNSDSRIGSGNPAHGPMDANVLLADVCQADHVVAINPIPQREESNTRTSENTT